MFGWCVRDRDLVAGVAILKRSGSLGSRLLLLIKPVNSLFAKDRLQAFWVVKLAQKDPPATSPFGEKAVIHGARRQ